MRYNDYLRAKLNEALYAYEQAARDFHYVVDRLAGIAAAAGTVELGMETVVINHVPSKVVQVCYRRDETEEDNYTTVSFDVVIVPVEFENFELTSEEARICSKAIRGLANDDDIEVLRSLQTFEKNTGVYIFQQNAPVESLGELTFSRRAIESFFANDH